jgi:hypothetical protein
LVIASAAVVLIGVLRSFIEVAGSAERRSEDVAASVAWWRKWGLAVVGAAVALWFLGQVFAQREDAPSIDTADGGDEGRVQDDEWSIVLDLRSPWRPHRFHAQDVRRSRRGSLRRRR